MSGEARRKCDFCGYEFTRGEAHSSCGSCPVSSCEKMRCPNCGYEYLPEPGLVRFFRERRKRKEARR